VAGPVDISKFTAEPELTSIPADGLVPFTLPFGAVLLFAVVTVPTASPALFNIASAAGWVRLIKFGTLTVPESAICSSLLGRPH
jgi:hypothetical protein